MPKTLFFPYFGPNRRSDKRVVEIRLDFEPEKDDESSLHPADLRSLLIGAGVLTHEDIFPGTALPDEPMASYASLLAQTAILFQSVCGHPVRFHRILSEPERFRCTALVEYMHCDVGMTAVKLAVTLLAGQMPSLRGPFQQFARFAHDRKLPAETAAIISAASRRGIPCYQLEQEPFANTIKLAHRVRRNGLLMLGHGVASHILDGTFCVDRSGKYLTAMLRNPDQRLSLLDQLRISNPNSTDRNPVDAGIYHILVINRQLSAIEQLPGDKWQAVTSMHPSIRDIVLAISEKADFAPLVVKFESTDIARPLSESGGKVLDFDLAPDLDLLFDHCADKETLLQSAATELIRDLFTDRGNARIPIIAVTGTNGKTTCTRMINHILREADHKPGMVCTDGVFLDGKQISHSDASSLVGHYSALTSKAADVAVLETHHRGIAVRGFAFDKCDVAVCLNVTEEHLKEGEIESVEEMSGIKRALMERASQAAVLNADDHNCMNMLSYLSAERICLVSLISGVEQLRRLSTGNNDCYCVLENVEGESCLVIHDCDERLVLMGVKQIPATFGGTAGFNTSNAMHAAAATFLLGTEIDAIRKALGRFSADLKMTPGRMNVFDELPFRVIVDFAHNPDGMKKVAEFADRQEVSGRKIIAFAGSDKRSERANRLCAEAVAGHFDFYYCKEYARWESMKPGLIAPLIQRTLVDAGIQENKTRVVSHGKDVIFSMLGDCKPGDLLIILAGHVEIKTIPGYIAEYADRLQI